MQESVDSFGTFHHDHVTTVLQDLQEGYEEDLTEDEKQRQELVFGNISDRKPLLYQGTGLVVPLFISH